MSQNGPEDGKLGGVSAERTSYLKICKATERLRQAMWGNLPRTEPVTRLKQKAPRARVGFLAQQQEVQIKIHVACLEGKLDLFVVPADMIGPVVHLPSAVVETMVTTHGGFADHVVRIQHSWFNKGLLAGRVAELMRTGFLVLDEKFETWLESERARVLWPSQSNTTRRPRGRPRQRARFDDAILAAVNDRRWRGTDGIPALRRLLLRDRDSVPSVDTLRRAVDDLYLRTGIANLRLRHWRTPSNARKRRKIHLRPKKNLGPNSVGTPSRRCPAT
jgi:hypothetical protein